MSNDDLNEKNLSQSDLSGADLYEAFLTGAEKTVFLAAMNRRD